MITVNISDALPAGIMAMLTDEAVESILSDVADAARAHWIRTAGSELQTSRQTYVQGIQEVESERGRRIIALVGWLPVAIEEGIGGWDLRATVLTGPNVKVSKSGVRMMRVPFRHGTPDTTGLAGLPMGSRYGPGGPASVRLEGPMGSEEAREKGKALYASIKPHGKDRGARRIGAKEPTGFPLLAPWHKADIYAGMKRERKTYIRPSGAAAVQSTYTTWRTITDRPPSEITEQAGRTRGKWIHPGISAHNFADRAADHARQVLPGIVRGYILGATGR